MSNIAKINKILLLFLLILTALGGGIYFWSDWKNKRTGVNEGSLPAGQTAIDASGSAPPKLTENFNAVDLVASSQKNESQQYQTGNALLAGTLNFARDIFKKDGIKAGLSTSDEALDQFTFVAIGDSEKEDGTGYENDLNKVLANVKELNPALTFFTGDILMSDNQEKEINRQRLENLKNLITSKNFSQYNIVFGNHEVECDQCVDLWQEIFFNKKYIDGEERILDFSFDYANTHFVLLSNVYPQMGSVTDQQLEWLDHDLSGTKQANKIILMHIPPITFFNQSAKNCHDMSCQPQQRDKLVEILERNKVDVVISGHEHAFDHKKVNGVNYVLSGNTGKEPRYSGVIRRTDYSIFKVTGTKIELKAVDLGGKVLREINLKN